MHARGKCGCVSVFMCVSLDGGELVTVHGPNFTECKATVTHTSPCKSVCLWCFGETGAAGSLEHTAVKKNWPREMHESLCLLLTHWLQCVDEF